jgi:hypothetical protein
VLTLAGKWIDLTTLAGLVQVAAGGFAVHALAARGLAEGAALPMTPSRSPFGGVCPDPSPRAGSVF